MIVTSSPPLGAQQVGKDAHKPEIMDRRQAIEEGFADCVQMVQIAKRIVRTGVAVATGKDRQGGLDIPIVLDVDGVKPAINEAKRRRVRIGSKGVQASIPRIARRQGAIEHLIAHSRTGSHILRVTDAKRVER